MGSFGPVQMGVMHCGKEGVALCCLTELTCLLTVLWDTSCCSVTRPCDVHWRQQQFSQIGLLAYAC